MLAQSNLSASTLLNSGNFYFSSGGANAGTLLIGTARNDASHPTGNGNTAMGVYSFGSPTCMGSGGGAGSGNVAIGYWAGCAFTTAANNVAIGANAAQNNSTGTANVFIGQEAGASSGGDTGDIGIGYFALTGSTNGYNVAVGYHALTSETGAIFGGSDIAIGDYALFKATTVGSDIAIGHEALGSVTISGGPGEDGTIDGDSNTAVGYLSMGDTTGGAENAAFGMNSLAQNTTGMLNFAMGLESLVLNTTGYGNAAIGADSLEYNTTGFNNTAVGQGAGGSGSATFPANSNATGTNNTFVGSNAMPGSATQQDHLTVIGADAVGTCSDCVVLGRNSDIVQIPNGIQFTKVYSVAGTPLPSCAAAALLQHLAVSDATADTPGTAYVGSGTYTIGIQCIYNSSGSAYTWIID
jgi:hypothetical protein